MSWLKDKYYKSILLLKSFYRRVLVVLGMATLITVVVLGAPIKGEIIDKTWNATIVTKNGIANARIASGYENYKDADGMFKAIDPSFVATTTGFEMTHAPFQVILPLTADGIAQMVNNNRYDHVSHTDIVNPPMTQSLTALGVDSVEGKLDMNCDLGFGLGVNCVIYANAYPALNADLIYYVKMGSIPELAKVIRSNVALNANTDLSFSVCYSDDVDIFRKVSGTRTKWLEGSKISVKDGLEVNAKATTGRRGFSQEPYKMWDSGQGRDFKEEAVSVSLDPTTPNCFELTKHLLATTTHAMTLPWFTDTTTSFYGATGTTYPLDGHLGLNAGTAVLATTRNPGTGDTTSNAGATVNTYTGAFAGNFAIFRGYFNFDTSAIGAGNVVTSAALNLNLSGISNPVNDGEDYYIVLSGQTANTSSSLPTSQYGNCYSTTTPIKISNSHDGTDLNASGTGAYYIFTISTTTVISVSGTSPLCVAEGHDVDSASAVFVNSWDEADWKSADTAGTSSDPFLTVTYNATASSRRRPPILISLWDSMVRTAFAK